MGYSGAGGKLIHEKNQKQKSRYTVPVAYFLPKTITINGKQKKEEKKTRYHFKILETM